jgi:carboxymethylenebutenolidase
MCDDNDMGEYLPRSGDLTRRQFGALSAGTGLAMLLPSVVNALDVTEADIDIPTPDGTADCYFARPSSGAHPGVLLWPDAGGLRPAYRQMGKRLAESGYSVLVVNPYYRSRRAPVMPPPDGISLRDYIKPFQDALNAETAVTDAVAFVRFLDSQAAVDKNRGIGTVGYCMGGPYTLRTAAALPDRIGAGASFHGARLVTDQPDSPHLLIPKMKGRYVLAIGKDDDEREPETKNVLRTTFAAAGLPAEIEVYDALHGWCTPDLRVYDEAEAERAWKRLLVLFETALAT